MKRIVFLAILIGIAAMGANAQERRLDLNTEPDGFRWYSTFLNTNNTTYFGAQNANGSTIIPTSREYTFLSYHYAVYTGCTGYFSFKKGNIKGGGVCDKNGREIISPGKYDEVSPYHNRAALDFFEFKIDGKKGICDKYGREVIAPGKYDRFYFVPEASVKGYFEVEINGYLGACDVDGKEIIAPKYKKLIYDDYFDGFMSKDNDEYGTYNPLGIFLDATGHISTKNTTYYNNPNAKSTNNSNSNTNNTYNNSNNNSYNNSNNNSYNNSYNNNSQSAPRQCNLCGGSGRCCGAGNVAYANQYCNGTGRCNPCGGSGLLTNSFTGQKMNCTYCNGTGRCSQCSGSGRCGHCGGSGQQR